MSQLRAYSVGGTFHIVVNNQIGFTTGPEAARSTLYATDIFKMLQVPIFHVNGEDPEGVAQCVRLALDFRQQYRRDVVIDMYGYRRHGHNEADEPSFTQPLLYQAISERKSVREGYLDHLLKYGGVTLEQAEEIAREQAEQDTTCGGNAGNYILSYEWNIMIENPTRADLLELTGNPPKARLARVAKALRTGRTLKNKPSKVVDNSSARD